MAVEAKRGCGYRKVGGLYLVGSGTGLACDRLPIPLEICPCCGQGIKQTRGWTWVNTAQLVGGDHTVPSPVNNGHGIMLLPCPDPKFCPLCHNVASMGKSGLLWIGSQFYPTVAHFDAEASRLGISRRITSLPRGFEIGKSWVLFAHAQGTTKPGEDGLTIKYVPAIFRVWKPERLERIFKESDRGSAAVQADEKRGITPIFVPNLDRDHQGSVYDKEEETENHDRPATPRLF